MAWPTAEMEGDKPSYGCALFRHEKPSPTLQILAFVTAKNMSRLVSLYKSLTDEELFKLRNGPVKSPGVAFLNSTDETYLLGLACKEKLEDLNQIASVVSRLSKSCVDEELSRFETAYHSMKQGIIDTSNLDFNSRNAGKIIEKMEKYENSTSLLYASLVGLNELESSEKKMQRLKETNMEYLNEKISFKGKQVRHFKQVSLWNKTFDKSVVLMARIICIVYVRICVVFGPFVPGLLSTTTGNRRPSSRLYVLHSKVFHMKIYPKADYCFFVEEDSNNKQKASNSCPIFKASRMKRGAARVMSSELPTESQNLGFLISGVTVTNKPSTVKNNVNRRLIQSAPPNTVGAAGLTFRYADIIIVAETYFYLTTIISDAARKHLFEMLPINLKKRLRGKLRSHWYKGEREGQGLAQGWREALAEIIGWLAPLAHDTLRWQQERNLEKHKLDARPTFLLLQTLHFSDLEKTEAAIVEVLVGLSCIYRYENRREANGVRHKGRNAIMRR